jgi:protein involved in ribonucleotide reduction
MHSAAEAGEAPSDYPGQKVARTCFLCWAAFERESDFARHCSDESHRMMMLSNGVVEVVQESEGDARKRTRIEQTYLEFEQSIGMGSSRHDEQIKEPAMKMARPNEALISQLASMISSESSNWNETGSLAGQSSSRGLENPHDNSLISRTDLSWLKDVLPPANQIRPASSSRLPSLPGEPPATTSLLGEPPATTSLLGEPPATALMGGPGPPFTSAPAAPPPPTAPRNRFSGNSGLGSSLRPLRPEVGSSADGRHHESDSHKCQTCKLTFSNASWAEQHAQDPRHAAVAKGELPFDNSGRPFDTTCVVCWQGFGHVKAFNVHKKSIEHLDKAAWLKIKSAGPVRSKRDMETDTRWHLDETEIEPKVRLQYM